MRPHPRLAAAIAATTVLFTAVAAQASGLTPVRATPAGEMLPAAGYNERTGHEVLTWSQTRPRTSSTYDAYLQQHGGPLVKLNKRGHAWSGDVDVRQHLAVYQQVRGDDSRIMFYDWRTRARFAAPEQVNTPAWEFMPRLQGNYLLFGRETWQSRPRSYELLLFNRADGTLKILDMIPHGFNYGVVDPGQINGNWVVWHKATDRWATERIYRYNLATGVTEEVPYVADRDDSGPSVAADGTAYFVRSAGGCGQRVQIRSFTGQEGTSTTLVYPLRPGREIDTTYVEGRPGGATHLLFSRRSCNSAWRNWEIYRLRVEDLAPLPASVVGHGTLVAAPTVAPWEAAQLHH